ncbi:M16 family metallopeptidase [Persicimonas caeni]|nr:pitrilysin family protein [Persicimonas caeni]
MTPNTLRLADGRAAVRRIIAALVVALVAASTLVAVPNGAEAKEPRDLIKTKTLDNGLEVIVLPDPSLPIVTIEMAVKNGAFTEPPKYNGLSHLYEHMFFKGNAVIPNQEAYLERMRELGIVFNGTTSTERVNYFFTLPKDNFEEGMEFMYNAITSPKFDEEEFEKEKKVVIGEVDRNESNPYYWFGQAIEEKLWYAHPSRKDPLGDRKSVLGATVDQMNTMQERYYVPNNSALLIAGDVEPEKAFEIAKEMYGEWEKGPDPFEKWPVPEHPELKEKSYLTVERDVKVPYVQFSWHGPSVTEDPKATYAADVLSFILSQPTSRFQKRLVESGLTLGAGISYYTQARTGPINVNAQVAPQNLKKAIRAVLEEIHRLEDPDYYTDEQLESAKTILAVQDTYDREKTSSFAHTVSFWWATAGLDYYLDYVENLKAVTRADIARYVKEYIGDDPYVMGVLLSKEQKEQLGLTDEKLAEMVKEIEKELEAERAGEKSKDKANVEDSGEANES